MHTLDALVRETPVLDTPALVGVDGVDGSGKTTFAARLACRFEHSGRTAHVVHLDDFLNPREVRHRRGRDSPDGFFRDTYDLGAFSADVIEPVRGGGRRIVPRVFDHRANRPVRADPIEVGVGDVVIVEGMFLHREELAAVWDLSVFLDVPFATSVARMAARDGTSPDPDHPSLRRYVEGQRIYLAACDPKRRATHVLPND